MFITTVPELLELIVYPVPPNPTTHHYFDTSLHLKHKSSVAFIQVIYEKYFRRPCDLGCCSCHSRRVKDDMSTNGLM